MTTRPLIDRMAEALRLEAFTCEIVSPAIESVFPHIASSLARRGILLNALLSEYDSQKDNSNG